MPQPCGLYLPVVIRLFSLETPARPNPRSPGVRCPLPSRSGRASPPIQRGYMFRKRLVAVSILATAVLSSTLGITTIARAEEVLDLDAPTPPKKGAGKAKPAGGEAKKKGGVDIDLDEDAPKGKSKPAVVAGNPTEAAAQAKALFDKEKWSEAAQALHRVRAGETGDDPGNKQLAEYFLAIALYRLKFYQASYQIFSGVADNPNHLKFKETLLWLAKLATQLPEPADIIERVGKYNDEQVGRFDNDH